MSAPVNPEGQTAREPKADWRVSLADGIEASCVDIVTPDGDVVAQVYGNAAHLETAYQRAVAICASRNAVQTAQEVRRAVNDGRQSAYVHVLALVASCLRAEEEEALTLASTPSPAKQTEQKIASAEGAASQLGAAPAPLDLLRIGPNSLPPGPSALDRLLGARPAAPAQPDARDAGRLRALEDKAAEARREWTRAETAEAEAARLTKELEEARAAPGTEKRRGDLNWYTVAAPPEPKAKTP